MQEVAISVDVMCTWDIEPPVYRLYVDDDLLTERSYIWRNPEQRIRENIVVNIDPGLHTLRIETKNKNCAFYCLNFKVNNEPQYLLNNQFTVQ